MSDISRSGCTLLNTTTALLKTVKVRKNQEAAIGQRRWEDRKAICNAVP
jgi:hypothetical protein